jgi:FkbM family methyltransferase
MRRRLRSLRHTPAKALKAGHIDSLELLRLLDPTRIRVIYDVGAFTGTWARVARSVFPASAIHAFEPLQRHCAELNDQRADIGNLEVHCVAAGNKNATATMIVTELSDSSSLLRVAQGGKAIFGIREKTEEIVEVVTLDSFVERNGLPLPDLMKIDVQGYELAVLEGAASCLASASAILVEVSFVELYEGQPLFRDIVCYLGDRGFLLHAFPVTLAGGRPLIQTDALFLSVGDDRARESVGAG